MSIIKSFSVGNGDMFYIKHGSSNFTIIDCFMGDDNKETITNEIIEESKGKDITRFISTHPDEDHLKGLKFLDEKIGIINFYCVENNATKKDESDDFKHYCKLRDGEHHYYIYQGCRRKWMNDNDETDGKNYGSSGINCLWPDVDNEEYKDALEKAFKGTEFNNISPILRYKLDGGATVLWMGDMEHDFLEEIKDYVEWPKVDILFAPHHGRSSGKVSSDILKKIEPKIIVIGEAPSEYIDYHYAGYNTITQKTAKNIVFDCHENEVDVYFSNGTYSYDLSFLKNKNLADNKLGCYMGTLTTHK